MDKLITDILYFFIDVDGTLTDGRYAVSGMGEIIKTFHTRDFHGIEMLLDKNIQVHLITQSSDGSIIEQHNRLREQWSPNPHPPRGKGDLFFLHFGVENKKRYINDFLIDDRADWENVAYIGDAENDVLPIQNAAFSACPNDALPEIKMACDYISPLNGGYGAVHDIIRNFIESNTKPEVIDKSI